ncbi:unnamed protein product [Lepeophtheirus salmonis]|uniref:(salmon louse) hypothetical protein n=1 Tax=Lepeophtheirus salmonis TaxID=72036 RepID=A0A7R8CG65_LEPSM|nr:unnamed protein product [Lepeophtheirus salmonis]CAF2813118.1 unnamed protein product [Lepeophtheirus salmonis]
MELVSSEDELHKLKKADLIILIKGHLIESGSDPKSDQFEDCSGVVESMLLPVRIIKSLVKKNPGLSLDELFLCRSTPLVCGKTPSKIMFSRKIQTRLDAILPHEVPFVKGNSKTSKTKKVWCRI